MSNRFPSALRRALVLAALAVAAASCTGTTVVRDYGPEARANFIDACTTDRSVVDGEVIEERLAPRSTCACIYTAMKDEFRLPWDDLSDFESAAADAKDGEKVEMPPQLEKAVKRCTSAGPAAPSVTTTTAEPG